MATGQFPTGQQQYKTMDRAPVDGTVIMGLCGSHYPQAIYWSDGEWLFWHDDEPASPAYWCRIPVNTPSDYYNDGVAVNTPPDATANLQYHTMDSAPLEPGAVIMGLVQTRYPEQIYWSDGLWHFYHQDAEIECFPDYWCWQPGDTPSEYQTPATPVDLTPTFTTTHWRFRTDTDSVDTAPTWSGAEDVASINLDPSDTFRIRISIQETGGGGGTIDGEDFVLEVDEDGGGYETVDSTTGNINLSELASVGSVHDNVIEITRLTGTGTYEEGNYRTTSAESHATLVQASGYTEMEFGLVVNAAADPAAVFTFRFGGVVLGQVIINA